MIKSRCAASADGDSLCCPDCLTGETGVEAEADDKLHILLIEDKAL